MKLAVVGSRSFNDYDLLSSTISQLVDVSCIVSGGAQGADSLGERYANENGIAFQVFLPDWKKHGRSAGIQRNLQILENSDAVVAFWDGKSKGTRHTIETARKMGKHVQVINVDMLDEKMRHS
jgi:predicted Rossmann fold nucleotide-binding protein DprA/Smf involved in DNA uptake